MKKYFLGVDGGNTKTDYLLCTIEGAFVDMYRTGTCSHECFDDGYDGMERAMGEQLSALLTKNGITTQDIAAAGFGLAGADLPGQVKELKNRVEKLGFDCYGLFNDGLLGIKAASDSGIGLSAVNGTGTVVIGADEKGQLLQVGGVGPVSGDNAGGGYIVQQIMCLLYSHYFRCDIGSPQYPSSAMFPKLLELLNANPDDLLSVISDYDLVQKNAVDIIQIANQAAHAGDLLAENIFDNVGSSIGFSASGCIKRLSFEGIGTLDNPLEVVLVGSIWNKVNYSGMPAVFSDTIYHITGKECRLIYLNVPVAIGGVLWAKEIADNASVTSSYRQNLTNSIINELKDV